VLKLCFGFAPITRVEIFTFLSLFLKVNQFLAHKNYRHGLLFILFASVIVSNAFTAYKGTEWNGVYSTISFVASIAATTSGVVMVAGGRLPRVFASPQYPSI
jgi:hypothetical protein